MNSRHPDIFPVRSAEEFPAVAAFRIRNRSREADEFVVQMSKDFAICVGFAIESCIKPGKGA
jgi:hypothetical protein